MFKSTTLKIILRKRVNKDGLAPIYLMFFQDRKTDKLSLKKFIPLEAWEDRGGNYVNSSINNSTGLNIFLRNQLNRAQEIVFEFERRDEHISFQRFKEIFYNQTDTNFLSFCEIELGHRSSSGKFSSETIRSNHSKLSKLKEFSPNVSFSDLTVKFLERYEHHLLYVKGNSCNTVFGAMKFIRTMLNSARRQDLTDVYPFDKFKITYKKDTRDRLNAEEVEALQKIYDTDTLKDNHQVVLRYFLFACYTGLTWGDLVSLKYDEIEQSLSSYVIKKKRQKTKQSFVVPIIENARRLIDLRQELGLVFPEILTNQKSNAIIKEIVGKSKIKKHVTFHVARHTFGTIALNNGIPREVVQKMLGHASPNQTDLYSKVLDTYVIDQMKKMDNMGRLDRIADHYDLEILDRYKKLRIQLVSARIISDQSEASLAEKLGMTEKQYIKLERGESALTVLDLMAIIDELGTEVILKPNK